MILVTGGAGYGESVEKPLKYYDDNVIGIIRLMEIIKKFNSKKIVFSSSATVYCDPLSTPIKEDFPVGSTTNSYGTSKYVIERILHDLYTSDNSFKVAFLRYFNPVRAHESGKIGEDPNGIPNNLMQFVFQVAVGNREYLSVLGDDYATHNDTGVSDYRHVVDLADAHVKVIEYLNKNIIMEESLTVNIGIGNSNSALDIVKVFENSSGKEISHKIVNRRADDICKDSWNWQKNNQNGY